jgi:hypothetical protein
VDPGADFGHFEDQRETNIALLRGLPAEAGNRQAMHSTAGAVTLSHMLHEWALGAGPLGEEYKLKP